MFPNIKIKKVKSLFVFVFAIILILAVFSQVSAKPTSDVGFGSGKNLPPTRPQRLSVAMAGVATYHLQPSDWLYYKSNGDFSAYLGKKSSTLPTVRYQKDNNYLQFSLNNVSSTTSASLETNTKTPNTPTLFYRNAFSDTDVTYQITNIPFKVKEEIVLKNPPAAPERSYGGSAFGGKSTTFTFSAETTGKPVKQKDGSIAFFGDNGEYLFQLDKPFMVDARGIISDEVSVEIIPLASLSSEKLSSYQVKNNSQFSISNFQSIFNDPIFKPISSLFSSLKIENYKFNRNSKLEIENSKPRSYQIILSANSEWLKTATYPVIIDPTVTHNADSNFTGQMNRVADSDTTSSTQLESSYPEAVKDPYTVLLLHFNEANGTTVGITDMASTTRVITANDNASTASSVTQLGLGNSAAFDGTGDYLSMPDSDDWDFYGKDFSIDLWLNLNTSPSVSEYSIYSQGVANHYPAFHIRTDGAIAFDISDNISYGSYITNPLTWVPGRWYHVAVERVSSKIYMFIDGVSQKLIEQNALSLGAMPNFGGLTYIGTFYDSGAGYFNGKIDEFRILKGRALTPEEIKATASRRPYAVYTSPVIDATASMAWNTVNWTEGGVNTGLSAGAGNGEQPYSTNSLVAQWDFNETSGTTATSSANGSCVTCAGTLTNFASTASQDQAAGTGWTANNKKWGAGALMMESAATADYVSISDPASNALDPGTGDFSVEGWIKSSAAGQDTILQNNTTVGACASNAGYILIVNGNRNLAAYASDGTTCYVNNLTANASSTEIADGRWHHFAFVADRDTKAYVYYDGRLATSTTINNTTAANPAATIYFGASGATGDSDFILDSARYYSRALSAAEILSNYNAGNIEIQTRTGATSDPNDGSWEAWKPTTGETQLFSLDSDAVNWHSDIMASTTIATSTETVIKAEGTGSLKIRTGMASTTAGTVALWHFEETGTTTGTYLYDSTANANNATTTGTTVVDGIFGKARKFNGSTDSVQVTPGVGNFSNGTIEAWIYPVLLSGSACNNHNGLTSCATLLFAYDFGYMFGVNSDGAVILDLGNGTSAWQSVNNTQAGLIITGKWQYVVATLDTDNKIRYYVNGILQYTSGVVTNSGFKIGTANIVHIAKFADQNFSGSLDEVKISSRVLSTDEIAETYRMGANHHLTRQVSATDLSGANKLAFNVAGDRPGTYLEAMLGESDYANYEIASSTLALSTTTVLYIKGDEIAFSTSIKDSSFSGKTITVNGDAKISGNGKIGNSVYFDGTGDYLTAPDSDDWDFGTNNFSVDFWVYNADLTKDSVIAGNWDVGGSRWEVILLGSALDDVIRFQFHDGGGLFQSIDSGTKQLISNNWQHIAIVRSGNDLIIFSNGVRIGSGDVTGDSIDIGSTGNFYVGDRTTGFNTLTGYLDSLRILKGRALTPDQIRQAYEYGLRAHPITIDFGATLQSSDLISSATDYNFSITATTSGLSATTSGLYLGDKIIIKENLGGTEYAAQGTVNSINTTTGAITVPSWDTGSTFPSGNGYSPNATVFKWQREYFDITGAATTTRDAITNLTLRPTNGAEGRTIYLDDFRYNTNYLTASSSSAITSVNNRYLQYRAIFSSWDSFVSPYLTGFNTLYTALAQMFPSLIGVSGGGFLSF